MEIKYKIGKIKTNFKSLDEKMMEKGVAHRLKCVICTKNLLSAGVCVLGKNSIFAENSHGGLRKNRIKRLSLPEILKKTDATQNCTAGKSTDPICCKLLEKRKDFLAGGGLISSGCIGIIIVLKYK